MHLFYRVALVDTLNFQGTWWTRTKLCTMSLNYIWRSIPIFLDQGLHNQDISLVRIYFNPVCHELILENSWPTTGSSKSRCFRQDVISLFFPTPDCLSFKLSVLFCFSKRFFYLRAVDSRFHRTILLAKKKIYTLCCLRFCLYLRILKIRLIHMLYRIP